MNPKSSRDSVTSSINSGDDFVFPTKDAKHTNISEEKKEEPKPCTYSSANKVQPKPPNSSSSKMSNGKRNNTSSNLSRSTREEDITQDDLQAMKAMIGDIKKDPSLLYRLSSLAAGDGPSAFNLGALGGDNNNMNNMGGGHMFPQSTTPGANSAMQNSIEVTDDHTEVSSLGMTSYDGSGKNLFHPGYQQFSPLQQMQMGPRETMALRTNRDVEIALRMQSLRAKKGLNNNLFQQGGGSNLSRSNSATMLNAVLSQQGRSPSTQRGEEIKQKEEVKAPSEEIPNSASQHENKARDRSSPVGQVKEVCEKKVVGGNEMRKSLSKDHVLDISLDELSPSPAPQHKNSERGRSVPSVPKTEEVNIAGKAVSTDQIQANYSPIKSNQRLERHERRPSTSSRQHSTSRQRSLVTPEPERRQQSVAAAAWSKEAVEFKRGSASVKNNIEGNAKDDDENSDSHKSAMVLYNDCFNSTNTTPRNENRMQLRDCMDPLTLNGGYNNSTLPFQRKESDRAMKDNDYLTGVSKYTAMDNSRDGKIDQFKRSSSSRSASRSTSRQRESTPRKEDYVRSESKHGVRKEAEHRRSRSDLPQIKMEKQTTDSDGGKKSKKSQRSESTQPKRSTSEHPKHDKGRRSRSRQTAISSDKSLPKRDMTGREPPGVMQHVDNNHDHEPITHASKHSDEGKRKMDKVSLHPSPKHSHHSDQKEPGLDEQLQKLNLRDRNYHHENESQSGRSVISRISHLVVRKAPRRPSESMGSYQSCAHEQNSSPHSSSNISPKKSIESDDGSLSKSGSNHRTIISRLSHSRLTMHSPQQTNRRRTTTIDNMNTSLTPSDWEKTTIKSASEAPFMSSEPDALMGSILGVGDEMTRACDDKGRCIFHPHIRLQKQKLFGGWKIIFKHCPDCAVEHMKKTQKELAARQLKAKKKKHKEKRDQIANEITDISFEGVQEKKSRKHKSKKRHSSIEKESSSGVSVKEDQTQQIPMKNEHSRTTLREDRAGPRRPSVTTSEPTTKFDKPKGLTPPDLDSSQLLQSSEQVKSLQIFDPSKPPHPHNLEPVMPPHNSESEKEDASIVPANSLAIIPKNSLAIVERKEPKVKKVNGLPWSDYNGQSGRYTGEVNYEYLPHGRGEMIYDRGVVSSGIWYKGVLDTEGPLTQDEYVPDRLQSYSVGDKGRDEDMIVESKRETAASVAQLRVSDAAFVRRSDGTWTYAVVKDRTEGNAASIKFKVNARGSTKSFPASQWGSYIRRIKQRQAADAPAKKELSLDQFLSNNNRQNIGSSHSIAGGNLGISSDHSVSSARSAPLIDRSRSVDNLLTGKMKIRTRSRSRSRNRKNVTTLPLLFSSSMSVSEENEGNDNDCWETASGSGYRLRGIDP